MIEKYKCERKVSGKSEATINRELALLKNMFNKCIEWGFARKNPVRDVKLYREENARTRYLTEDEANKLLQSCNSAS